MAETFDDLRESTPGLDTIWFDGEFVPWESATVHVCTHGLHYGTAVFEGVRCYDTAAGPALFRWDDHLRRFRRSGRPLGIELPYTRAELTEATVELIDRQGLESCYVRPIAFYGDARLGVNPTGNPIRVAIAAWPWGTYLGEGALETGIDVAVSSWRRPGSGSFPTAAKAAGPYVNNVVASREAAANGHDEAVLLNGAGTVAEGPGENLFLVRDGELATPGLAEGALPGITRDTVVELARGLGYAVDADARIGRGELYTADELFLTGTAAELTPIRRVDGIPVGDGTRGPVTERLQARFFEIVERRVPDHEDWFTFVGPVPPR